MKKKSKMDRGVCDENEIIGLCGCGPGTEDGRCSYQAALPEHGERKLPA